MWATLVRRNCDGLVADGNLNAALCAVNPTIVVQYVMSLLKDDPCMDEVHVALIANLIDTVMHASEGEFKPFDIGHCCSSSQHASASQALSEAVEQAAHLANPDKYTDMAVEAAITCFQSWLHCSRCPRASFPTWHWKGVLGCCKDFVPRTTH